MWYLIRTPHSLKTMWFDAEHIYPGSTWDIMAGPCTWDWELPMAYSWTRLKWGRFHRGFGE